jgi:hypothetical protein
MIEQIYQVQRSEILFVSSNDWDALGATWFGWEAVWLNRNNNPIDRLGPGAAHAVNHKRARCVATAPKRVAHDPPTPPRQPVASNFLPLPGIPAGETADDISSPSS